MFDFLLEYILPIFLTVLLFLLVLYLSFGFYLSCIYVKDYSIENTNNDCVCEKVSD